MKLKINKACDLSSISVLPPQSRRLSGFSGGLESSSILGRSQTASQPRTQQSLSQGASSQHSLFTQFSQNSQDEILTNEKVGSQERENSLRRTSCLPPINYTREESQMVVSRTSNNLMRKWPGQEYKCHISKELEHRIGMIETSLSRFGRILDSVQSDTMLANKGTRELTLETKDVKQKLISHDESLQLISKGQEEIRTCLDLGLKSLSEKLQQIKNQENLGQIISSLSDLSEKIDSQMVKLQNDLHEDFCKEIQAISCSTKISTQKQSTASTQGPKAPSLCNCGQLSNFASGSSVSKKIFVDISATRHLKTHQRSIIPKVETGGWTSVKQELAATKVGNLNHRSNQKNTSRDQLEHRVVIESDEEIDVGLSCLIEEKGTEMVIYSVEEANQATARILRKARRRKRKHCNSIIIN